jgi:hypothetical protein
MNDKPENKPTEEEISAYYVIQGIKTIITLFASAGFKEDEIEKVLSTLTASFAAYRKVPFEEVMTSVKSSYDLHEQFMKDNPDAGKSMDEILKKKPGADPLFSMASDKTFLN